MLRGAASNRLMPRDCPLGYSRHSRVLQCLRAAQKPNQGRCQRSDLVPSLRLQQFDRSNPRPSHGANHRSPQKTRQILRRGSPGRHQAEAGVPVSSLNPTKQGLEVAQHARNLLPEKALLKHCFDFTRKWPRPAERATALRGPLLSPADSRPAPRRNARRHPPLAAPDPGATKCPRRRSSRETCGQPAATLPEPRMNGK